MEAKPLATKKVYLDDTYKFEHTAKVLRIAPSPVVPTEQWITLDETIFHPQGGGQPSDEGQLVKDDIVFNVTTLQVDGDIIIHKGNYAKEGAEFKLGDTVKLIINKDKRLLSAKLHSAGHLLDVCFHSIGYTNTGTKGYHFPEGPNVEFAGKLGAEEREKVKVALQEKINEVLKATTEADAVDGKVYSYEEAGKVLGTVPSYLKEGMNVRIIRINSLDKGCPCGGTHVKHIKELGAVKIEKVKSAGSKAFKIYYQLVDSL